MKERSDMAELTIWNIVVVVFLVKMFVVNVISTEPRLKGEGNGEISDKDKYEASGE